MRIIKIEAFSRTMKGGIVYVCFFFKKKEWCDALNLSMAYVRMWEQNFVIFICLIQQNIDIFVIPSTFWSSAAAKSTALWVFYWMPDAHPQSLFFNHSLNMSKFQLCSIDIEEIGREGGMGRRKGEGRW